MGSFLRKPPPELHVVPLELAAILQAAERVRVCSGRVPVSDTRARPQETGLF